MFLDHNSKLTGSFAETCQLRIERSWLLARLEITMQCWIVETSRRFSATAGSASHRLCILARLRRAAHAGHRPTLSSRSNFDGTWATKLFYTRSLLIYINLILHYCSFPGRNSYKSLQLSSRRASKTNYTPSLCLGE